MTQQSFKKGDFVVHHQDGVGEVIEIISVRSSAINYLMDLEKEKMNLRNQLQELIG